MLKNIWIFGPLYAVPLLFWVHTWIWSPASPVGHQSWFTKLYGHSGLSSTWSSTPLSNLPDTFVGFSVAWLLVVVVLGTIAQLMAVIATFEGSQGKTLSFDNLWATTRKMVWRLLGVYILSGVLIFVGFILLIVPGFIMVRRYFLAPYVMLDKNPSSVYEALRISAAMSKPTPASSDWSLSSRGIWGIIGVTILIELIVIIPLIGSLIAFIVGMFYSVAPALRYRELKKLST